jgi:excisionase family DNA binding protein
MATGADRFGPFGRFDMPRSCGTNRRAKEGKLDRGEARVVEGGVERYLKTSEVARLLHVSPKTVTRWAKDGKLPHSRTLGGHRRFPAGSIEQLAQELIQSV